MDEKALISKAMAALGSRKSDRKTVAARANAARPRPRPNARKQNPKAGRAAGVALKPFAAEKETNKPTKKQL